MHWTTVESARPNHAMPCRRYIIISPSRFETRGKNCLQGCNYRTLRGCMKLGENVAFVCLLQTGGRNFFQPIFTQPRKVFLCRPLESAACRACGRMRFQLPPTGFQSHLLRRARCLQDSNGHQMKWSMTVTCFLHPIRVSTSWMYASIGDPITSYGTGQPYFSQWRFCNFCRKSSGHSQNHVIFYVGSCNLSSESYCNLPINGMGLDVIGF